ncbi:hypothetical protein P7C70_g6162, partial [Phenoliferia sp. Uapishka_3]
MSVLDLPRYTMASLKAMYNECTDDPVEVEPLAIRRASPVGLQETIQRCPDCKRWGTVSDTLFNATGWVGWRTSTRSSPSELTRPSTRAERLGYLANPDKDVDMWVHAIDAVANLEVTMLQTALLEDHQKFVPQCVGQINARLRRADHSRPPQPPRSDVARQLIERDREAARRTWLIALKIRIASADTPPTLADLRIPI